jgi:energy-coupling factor transporter ATP-binding protein EcfA2
MTDALSIKGLRKSFGGLTVIAGADLTVAAGERRLIIGPNGAGKTTLFNLITGDLKPNAGTIALFGRDITRLASRRRAHLGLARTYQIITLFPRETLRHNVMLSLLGLSPARWNPFVISPSGRWPRPPTASGGASRSRWRWRRRRGCCCSTSPSPGSRPTSAASCTSSSSRFRATSR